MREHWSEIYRFTCLELTGSYDYVRIRIKRVADSNETSRSMVDNWLTDVKRRGTDRRVGRHARNTEVILHRAGRVPRSQDVVAAYGNSDEGDQSSGLVHWGPAWADHVGRVEAAAFLRAWRAAGADLSANPVIDSRWTRAASLCSLSRNVCSSMMRSSISCTRLRSTAAVRR